MENKILNLFNRGKAKWNLRTMARELGLRSSEIKNLRRNLKNLQKQGLIKRHRGVYRLTPVPYIIKGEYLATSFGYGFVRPEAGGPDIFIPPRSAAGAMHGDLVEIALKETKDGRLEGKVVRIVKAKPTILGFYRERFGQPFFLPMDDPSYGEMALETKPEKKLKEGEVIEVDRRLGKIVSIFGHPDDPSVDTQVIIKRHGLITAYSSEAWKEAEALSSRINQETRKNRKDFRGWKTFTIDGEDAQDFDDAVSLKRLSNGHYLLGVHIADVSHYVLPGTALDEEARRRGTSVYFPDLTLHMLPERLATDLCSLRPRVTRLTFSVLMEINRKGEVVQTEFHPSMIKTRERMTYTSVYKIFQGDKEERGKYVHIVDDILLMRDLASLFREKREAAGSLNFDLFEPELIYKEGKLAEVAALEQNEAHHLIEEFMVAANEAVATFFSEKGWPAIYRVHPAPAISDLEELRQKALALGLYLPRGEQVNSKDLQKLLRSVAGRPEEKFVNVQVLRSLRLAVYSDENIGHYGLAKDNYTHFTSPIRRYPDLITHRLLKAALAGKEAEGSDLANLATHCSFCERQAEAAERDLIEWRIFRLLQTKLGEEMRGLIVALNRAGVVVELEDYFVQGLLAFSDLSGDSDWRRSQEGLVGKRTGRRLRLGDRLDVILASVDPILRRINLVLPLSFWGKEKMMTRALVAIIRKENNKTGWPETVYAILNQKKVKAKLKIFPAPDWVPKGEELVFLHLSRQVDIYWGEKLTIQKGSDGSALALGRVIDPSPDIKGKKYSEEPWLRLLAGGMEDMLLALLRRQGIRGLREREIVEFSRLQAESLLKLLQEMEIKGLIKILNFKPFFLISQESLAFLASQIESFLHRYHCQKPEVPGVQIDKIRKRFRLPLLILRLALAQLKKEKKIVFPEKDIVSLAFHEIPLGSEEKKILEAMEEMFYRGEFRRVSLEEVRRRFHLSSRILEKLLTHLIAKKKIFQSADGFYIHSRWLEEIIHRLRQWGKREFTIAEFKALTGLSRKYAIPVLELLDKMGVTRRKGSFRETL